MNSNEQLLFGVRPLLLYQADNLEHGVVFPCANMYFMDACDMCICMYTLTNAFGYLCIGMCTPLLSLICA